MQLYGMEVIPQINIQNIEPKRLEQCFDRKIDNIDDCHAFGFDENGKFSIHLPKITDSRLVASDKMLKKDFIDALYDAVNLISCENPSPIITRVVNVTLKEMIRLEKESEYAGHMDVMTFIVLYNAIVQSEQNKIRFAMEYAKDLADERDTDEDIVLNIGTVIGKSLLKYDFRRYYIYLLIWKNKRLEWTPIQNTKYARLVEENYWIPVTVDTMYPWIDQILADYEKDLRKTVRELVEKLHIRQNREKILLSDTIYDHIPRVQDSNYRGNPQTCPVEIACPGSIPIEKYIKRWYNFIKLPDNYMNYHVMQQDKYKIGRITFARTPENTNKNTFDFITIEVPLCVPKEERKAYLDAVRSRIHKSAMEKLQNNKTFLRYNVSINYLRMYQSIITADGIYVMKLELKHTGEEKNE